jgi:hypothetical protein
MKRRAHPDQHILNAGKAAVGCAEFGGLCSNRPLKQSALRQNKMATVDEKAHLGEEEGLQSQHLKRTINHYVRCPCLVCERPLERRVPQISCDTCWQRNSVWSREMGVALCRRKAT